MIQTIYQPPYLKRYTVYKWVFSLFLLMAFKVNAAQFTASIQTVSSNRACFSGTMLANYTATITPSANWTFPQDYDFVLGSTKFELRKAETGPMGLVLATNFGGTVGNSTISGAFDISALALQEDLKPGVYTISASIYVRRILGNGNFSKPTIVYQTSTFTVGYNVTWSSLTDMVATPNASSMSRNVTTAGVTYASGISANYWVVNTNGFLETGAQFSSSSAARSVYLSLDNAATFNPSLGAYLEYRKAANSTNISGQGIYVKNGALIYKLQNVLITERVRVERVGGVIKFYQENSTTPLKARATTGNSNIIQNFSITHTNELYVRGYSSIVSDGLTSIVTSFPCKESPVYAQLTRQLRGENYKTTSKLLFYYTEEYVPVESTNLTYRIVNFENKTVQSSAAVAGSTQVVLPRKLGDNRYELSVTALLSNASYVLEVTNEKNEVFYLRFSK
ncbi:MAG: hypothetical protein QE487_07210 [Fluviicola sp.]|nr:hypothetical protein [Fluviicola sp.]